jgi:hypothetical protein
LLNKDDVIDCLPKLSRDLSSQHLSQLHKSSWIDPFTSKANNPPSTLPAHKQLFKEFSVVRIRHKLY